MPWSCRLGFALVGLLCPLLATYAAEAVWLDIEGPVGPATSEYVVGALEEAGEEDVSLVILRMDTPGGLDTAMRDIIKAILASTVPVIGYVSPRGARAASAGTYILYASHIAAMAPATNLGAATPVQLGGPGGEVEPAGGEAMERKVVNDAVAYIQGLARLRGRNAQWAEKAVREGASLSAEAALKENVIDLIAPDMDTLLQRIDGTTVEVAGDQVTLDTVGLTLQHREPDWRTRLLAILTDPNVAYILMLVGIYGLIFEFANPGTFVAGIIGAICLFLALFAFQVLPVNYAGLGLIVFGLALMVGEAFLPSFGALGIGGMAAFVIGSIILMDTDVPGFRVSLPLIGTFGLIASGAFLAVLLMAVKARHRPVVSGQEELIGARGEVLDDFIGDEGHVRVHGEIWRARATRPLMKGERVRVIARDGLLLQVEAEADLGKMEERI